ncbi:S46 family peptidase [Perlabentimonas gracilis]|uniref:S46 family peptidase n=1 Tax=Perlabentimonas gracilis TaxID=2715279 RepID=UPI001407795F|nr:S46 family peptidase [Perlabentimonas gracilis]NHB69327.1 S46 family peptidase [Perlabentimonas gracilis]
MKRFKVLLLSILLISSSLAKADEGMWLLPLLQKYNIATMQSMGLELSAEELYSINSTSLKDAIVIFGGGCTGEIISDKGLILTNHHCGYGAIQRHSSTEHDYLKDGFWAMSMDEEIATPGLSVTFLVRIEDVTDEITKPVKSKMTEEERSKVIEDAAKAIEEKATDGNHYRAMVRSYYGGNKYYLLVYERFTDVRMVGAPPSSIGKFGADTDNWMWPRHTGDFALFRVYADKDNKPADYSPDNVPYQPKHHLPVSLEGVEKGDFAMIMGYPGGTTRYMTSWEVDEAEKITNAQRSFIRGIRQEIILEDMLASDEIRIKYSSKYSGSTNYWKFSIGQNQALKRLKVKETKQKKQDEFTQWVNEKRKRSKEYGEALDLIRTAIEERHDYMYANMYISETLLRGTELVSLAGRANALYEYLKGDEDKGLENRIDRFRQSATAFYKDYNAPTDRKVAKAMFKLFAQQVKPEFHPSVFETIEKEYAGNFDKFIDHMFDNSIFADSTKLWKALENPTAETFENDPAFAATKSISEVTSKIWSELGEINKKFAKGHRLYVGGIMEMNEGQPIYPDANFTMRLTYGQVQDYYPRDAVHYNYITTLKGVMEKEDPDNWEFVVPEKLKELYMAEDYGPYAMDNGEMPVAFITNNDITGGNSGSPIINGKGHLIGCAFDGNWEAMSGDIIFEPDYQRCIGVDIRYVLFIIDKYAGAKHLVDEMTLVK